MFKDFQYVQKNGKNKQNNIFLLQSYIDLQGGKTKFKLLNNKQFKLLKGYLDLVVIKYITESKNVTVRDSSGKETTKIENNTINVTK